MAAAATIVARSTRLVHMIATSNELIHPCFRLPSGATGQCQPFPVHLSASTGKPCRTLHYRADPFEPAVLPVEPLVEPLTPPQSLAVYCGSVGLRLAHFDELLF